MLEQQRLAYLEAMGVDSYFPRFQLPGAKASVRCPLPVVARQVTEPAAESVPPAKAAGQSAAPGVKRDLKLADVLGEVTPPAKAKKPPTVADEKQAPTADIERFSLRFVHSGSGVLVIDDAAEPPPEKALLRFVAQVIYAISGKRDAQLRCSPFRWPMADNPQLDHSERAAREALHSSIGATIEREQVRLLLLMGEVPRRYLSNCAEQWPGVTRLSLSDSRQLMSSSEEKAALWAELQKQVVNA